MKKLQQLTGIITYLLLFTTAQNLHAQPPNDECVNAIDISDAFFGNCGDMTFNGPFTLTGATPGVDDPPEPGEAENEMTPGPYCPDETDFNLFGDEAEAWENSVWFTWTVPDLNGDGSSVTYSLQTSDGSFGDDCGISEPLGGDTDTQAAIYQGACPTATTGECDHYAASEDLFQEAPWISGWQSIQFLPGVTYYMGVDGWDAVEGEFCITVSICGQECGNGVCDPTETYCLCEDCQFDEDGLPTCPYGELLGVRYDENTGYYLYSSDLSGNIFFCSEFVNGFPSSNIYLAFAALPYTDCSGSSYNDINVSLSVGQILNGIDNGDGTYAISTNFVYFIELSPADIAAGSVTVTSFAPDGLGNICNQTLTVNFADFPQSSDPFCLGETFTLSTDGLEDLTLPCNSDDGSSFVYAWILSIDIYDTGDYIPITDWLILGTNPTINTSTFFIDELGYLPPYYTPGLPVPPLNPYTNQPWDMQIIGAAICINADGSFVDICLAQNEGYSSSEITVTFLPADDPLCSSNPPCTGEYSAYEVDPATGIPFVTLDFIALCPELVGATGDGLYIPFSFNSDDIPLGPDNITFPGSILSTTIGTIYTFVFGGSPQIPATTEGTVLVSLLYLSPADIAAGVAPTLTFVDASGTCTITLTIDIELDPNQCSSCELNAPSLVLDDGTNNTTICINDGIDEPVDIIFTDDGLGDESAWVITDIAGNILALPGNPPPFILDGAGEGECLIWIIHWCGTLSEPLTVGINLPSVIADSDAVISNSISVTRNTCGDCEEEITGIITTPDEGCDVSGIDITIIAPDGTTINVATAADGSFTVPGGPFPCGDYIAAFFKSGSIAGLLHRYGFARSDYPYT